MSMFIYAVFLNWLRSLLKPAEAETVLKAGYNSLTSPGIPGLDKLLEFQELGLTCSNNSQFQCFFGPCLNMLRPNLCWRQGTILWAALEFQGWTGFWNSKSLAALAATIHSFNWPRGLDCLSPHYLTTNSVGTKCRASARAAFGWAMPLYGHSLSFFRAADF